jgi:cell division protein FtsI/penicillin-binding protein 2
MGSLIRPGIYWFLFLTLLPSLSGSEPVPTGTNSATNQAIDHAPDHTGTNAYPPTLFAQSAIQMLAHDFSEHDVAYLLLDAHSGALLASHWENYNQPVPLGSLVKPFTALAYAETHDFRYPTFECRGHAGGCWQMHPHGKLDIISAISVSCNSYFRSLSESLTPGQIVSVTQAFDLESPKPGFTAPSLVGLGDEWKVSPIRMAHAYLELYRRRDQPGVRELLAGMQESAEAGTGAAVGRALKTSYALVKTGTAPCTHVPHAPADGFVVALVPARQPEILLMVRVHGVAGATAAETAARMLVRMEE